MKLQRFSLFWEILSRRVCTGALLPLLHFLRKDRPDGVSLDIMMGKFRLNVSLWTPNSRQRLSYFFPQMEMYNVKEAISHIWVMPFVGLFTVPPRPLCSFHCALIFNRTVCLCPFLWRWRVKKQPVHSALRTMLKSNLCHLQSFLITSCSFHRQSATRPEHHYLSIFVPFSLFILFLPVYSYLCCGKTSRRRRKE